MSVREQDKKTMYMPGFRQVVLFLMLAIAACALAILVSKTSRQSDAYLYDENSFDINYNIAQLDFDLFTNKMYAYYQEDLRYNNGGENDLESLLVTLDALQDNFTSLQISKSDYEENVITALKTFYPGDMIDALAAAAGMIGDSYSAEGEAAYNAAAKTVYDTYSGSVGFLFKIRNYIFTPSSGYDFSLGIWYYYVDNLISRYMSEFVVVQEDADTTSAKLQIGIKLKGGTTWSNVSEDDPITTDIVEGAYYDGYFNDMVLPVTYKFKNTGSADLYLKLGVLLDDDTTMGVLAFILPYGLNLCDVMTVGTDANTLYSSCLDGEGKILYRDFMIAVLDYYEIESGLLYAYEPSPSLAYDQLTALFNQWNIYALSTYASEEVYGNVKIAMKEPESQGDISNILSMGILTWADYEKCSLYYNSVKFSGSEDDNWMGADDYLVIKYSIAINIIASLKDVDFTQFTDDDFERAYNDRFNAEDKFIGVSNFDIAGYAFFVDPLGNETNVFTEGYFQNGYIVCNYTDPAAVNNISKLRLNINYRGYSPAYIRVQFIEQFTNSKGEIVAINQIKFDLADTWYDNRSDDLCFYSDMLWYSAEKDIEVTVDGKKVAKVFTVPVILGVTGWVDAATTIDPDLADNTDLTLQISIIIEAVQPNRIEAYWGISDIPSLNN